MYKWIKIIFKVKFYRWCANIPLIIPICFYYWIEWCYQYETSDIKFSFQIQEWFINILLYNICVLRIPYFLYPFFYLFFYLFLLIKLKYYFIFELIISIEKKKNKMYILYSIMNTDSITSITIFTWFYNPNIFVLFFRLICLLYQIEEFFEFYKLSIIGSIT